MYRRRVGHLLPRLVAATFGFVLMVGAASAQEVPDTSELGMGFFQVGYIGLGLDDLNGNLSGASFPSLSESFLTLGGAGYGSRGRFMIGGEGHALLGSSETTMDGATRLSAGGGYGFFRLGYRVLSHSGLDASPVLGVGGGGIEVKIAERSSPTFGDVLADPQRSSTLSSGMFLLDASMALLYRITLNESEEGEAGGILVGFQGGYTFAPGSTSWRLDDLNDVAGGPKVQIEGLHVSLAVGGWGQRR